MERMRSGKDESSKEWVMGKYSLKRKGQMKDTGDKDQNTHQAHAGYIGSTDNK